MSSAPSRLGVGSKVVVVLNEEKHYFITIHPSAIIRISRQLSIPSTALVGYRYGAWLDVDLAGGGGTDVKGR